MRQKAARFHLKKRNPLFQNSSFSKKKKEVESHTGENSGRPRSEAYQYTN